ncbi:MAG TPA: HAMP domain-containing sensor histidine kinase [Solirubrobacteraceae bacterium]|nr:HAMP domain-containing sensor histidine kinase [Solirubrobacteraceae bacterium]
MRRRLAVAIAGVATAAIVLFAVPLAILLGGAHRTTDLLRLQRDTFSATRQIDLSTAANDIVELPRDSDVLAVYDRTGRLVAGRGPATAPDVVRRALRSGRPSEASGGGPLVVAVPLVSRERVVGAVRAERPEGEASGDTTPQRVAIAGLALAIVAAAVLAALWLGRALARPLERLAATATRLGHGDFSVRAAPAGIPEVDAVCAALATTAQRIEEMVNRERAFSANASHQLRTPLQAIRIELEAAELRGDAPPEVHTALEQVDRLEATIATLLAVARDAPRRDKTTELGDALEVIQAHWHGRLAASSRPLRIALPTEPLYAHADPRVIEQILDILLDNAERHGAGAVRIAVRELDGWLAIDVSDEGPGFDTDPEQVFSRRQGTSDGHGIGLALARSLTHAEGGRLTVTHARPAPIVTVFVPAHVGATREPTM